MTTFNFSNFVVDKSEILGESQQGNSVTWGCLSENQKITPKVSSSINLKTEKYRKGL